VWLSRSCRPQHVVLRLHPAAAAPLKCGHGMLHAMMVQSCQVMFSDSCNNCTAAAASTEQYSCWCPLIACSYAVGALLPAVCFELLRGSLASAEVWDPLPHCYCTVTVLLLLNSASCNIRQSCYWGTSTTAVLQYCGSKSRRSMSATPTITLCQPHPVPTTTLLFKEQSTNTLDCYTTNQTCHNRSSTLCYTPTLAP
jgi:hypothetical protein